MSGATLCADRGLSISPAAFFNARVGLVGAGGLKRTAAMETLPHKIPPEHVAGRPHGGVRRGDSSRARVRGCCIVPCSRHTLDRFSSPFTLPGRCEWARPRLDLPTQQQCWHIYVVAVGLLLLWIDRPKHDGAEISCTSRSFFLPMSWSGVNCGRYSHVRFHPIRPTKQLVVRVQDFEEEPWSLGPPAGSQPRSRSTRGVYQEVTELVRRPDPEGTWGDPVRLPACPLKPLRKNALGNETFSEFFLRPPAREAESLRSARSMLMVHAHTHRHTHMRWCVLSLLRGWKSFHWSTG